MNVGRFLPLKTGNLALIEIIRAEIQNRGPVPFAWFMEQALYHPEHGYYSSGRASIGRKGDYFTNVSIGPLFGQLLAAQFAEMRARLGPIDNFIIVEQGAHGGEFARDVLTALREKSPEFFSTLPYFIIEPFPVLQDRQSQALKEFGEHVQWRRSLDELEPFVGVYFSNELLDALPIDLRGKRVALENDNFVFIDWPEPGMVTNRAAREWIDRLAPKLERGFVVAVDYGFAHSEFREVLQVRAQHRTLDSPFEQIGEADITAHINWTDIAARAEANGLNLFGFTDQHHFLTGIISEFPALIEGEKAKRALQTLLHPEMLGRAFQVMALKKNVDLAEPLSGFMYARDPRAMLGP